MSTGCCCCCFNLYLHLYYIYIKKGNFMQNTSSSVSSAKVDFFLNITKSKVFVQLSWYKVIF